MLPENEIRERAQYCYCVFLQLSRLQENIMVEPARYLDMLKTSTLQLAEDEFIKAIIEEELMIGRNDGGMTYLIPLYEGFVHAYCEVLNVSLDDIRNSIPQEFIQKLIEEMEFRSGAKAKKIVKRQKK